jgi:glycosyltransferase involved in cell wall biosynthesis
LNERTTLDLVVPSGLETRTGGFIYDRRMVEALRERGWSVTVRELGGGFPQPSADELCEAASLLRGLPAGRSVLIDGLALGGMPELVASERTRLRLIALIHHPLALETGLDAATAQRLHSAERRALAAVSQVIVTSQTTAAALSEYAVAPELIDVVPPGTDRAPLATGSGTPTLQLLCVGTLTPRKGHALLIEALARLKDLRWRLACAGSTERDPACAGALEQQVKRAGLDERVVLLGELDNPALRAAYARADAFVLASYYEGYGMAFAEALAHGLPIVATAGGATAQTVPQGAGLLVPPGDVAALRRALRRLICDAALRAGLQAGAREARHSLPSWCEAGDRLAAAVLDRGAR